MNKFQGRWFFYMSPNLHIFQNSASQTEILLVFELTLLQPEYDDICTDCAEFVHFFSQSWERCYMWGSLHLKVKWATLSSVYRKPVSQFRFFIPPTHALRNPHAVGGIRQPANKVTRSIGKRINVVNPRPNLKSLEMILFMTDPAASYTAVSYAKNALSPALFFFLSKTRFRKLRVWLID